jgi:hypothetical protein
MNEFDPSNRLHSNGEPPPAPRIGAPIDDVLRRTGPGSGRPQHVMRDDRRNVPPAPPDYDPRVVKGDSAPANAARAALKLVHDSWRHIRDAAADPKVSIADLSTAAQRAVEKALTNVDKARTAIARDVATIEKRIAGKLTPDIDPQLAGEIRAFWRERSKSGAVLAEALTAASSDARTACALLTGPAYLSGLAVDQLELLRTNAIKSLAPEDGQQLDEARAALDVVTRAGARMLEQLGTKLRQWAMPQSASLAGLRELGR